MIKYIKLSYNPSTAGFLVLQKTRYLILSLNKKKTLFFKISDDIVCELTADGIVITLKKITGLSNPFFQFIKSHAQSASKKFKKQIRLRGMGYRVDLVPETNMLRFKLGYSHLVFVSIPAIVASVKIKKNKILFESYDKIFLGNFVYRILKLKVPDVYKGKGFLTKYNNIFLKTIKKK